MVKKLLKLHEIEIESLDYNSSKSEITISDVNTNKMILSQKFLSSKMSSDYFVG